MLSLLALVALGLSPSSFISACAQETTPDTRRDFSERLDRLTSQFEAAEKASEQGDAHAELVDLAFEAHKQSAIDQLEEMRAIGEFFPKTLNGILEVYIRDLGGETGVEATFQHRHLQGAMLAIEDNKLRLARSYMAPLLNRPGANHFYSFWIESSNCSIDTLSAQYSSAVKHLERIKALLSKHHLGTRHGGALAMLAQHYTDLGLNHEARLMYDELIDVAKTSGDLRNMRRMLIDRCTIHKLEKNYDEIVADATAALFTDAAAGGQTESEHNLRAHYYLGFALGELGDLESATEHYEYVIERCPDENKLAGPALNGLALICLYQRRLDRGSQLIDKAIRIERELGLIEYLLNSLQDKAKIEFARHNMPAVWASIAEAESLLESPQLHSLDPRAAAAARSRFSEWSEICQDIVFAEWTRAESRAEKTQLLQEGLRFACRWSGRALAENMGAEAEFSREVPASDLSKAIRTALPASSVLIHYVSGTNNLYAYSVNSEGLKLHDLGPREPIENDVSAFVRDVLDKTKTFRVTNVGLAAWDLYSNLLIPMRSALTDESALLYIVPTPELSSLPFDCLVSERPDNDTRAFRDLSFLVRDHIVVHVPTALMIPLLKRRKARSPEGPALLLGDVDFSLAKSDETSQGLDVELSHLPRLEGSRGEVLRATRTLVPEGENRTGILGKSIDLQESQTRNIEWIQPGLFSLYTGSYATHEVLTQNAERFGILHFATHSNEEMMNPASVALVLAGNTSDEMLLDVGEIRSLNIDPQLVLLSACSTAIGPEIRGDGLQSLATAFLDAGSREVIASLSPVRDQSTLALIAELYTLRGQGLPTREALKKAKQSLLEEADPDRSVVKESSGAKGQDYEDSSGLPIGHPRRWAPFIYMGY